MSESDSTVPAGFRVIPDYPRYAIDEHGTVLSVCPRNGKGKDRPWANAMRVKPIPDRYGYHQVTLCDNGSKRAIFVHTLVLTMFVGPCPSGMECRHIDGNESNNHVLNLAWGTRSENSQDKVFHGTDNRGDKCYSAKLTVADVLEIRARAAKGETQTAIAKDFPVKQVAISQIILRKTWKHV